MQSRTPKRSDLYMWTGWLVFSVALVWLTWTWGNGYRWAFAFYAASFIWFLIRDGRKYRRAKAASRAHQATSPSQDEDR